MSVEGMPVPGTVLDGKYRLVRQLGAGGMGIVFEADHIRLRQPFAIKILQPEFAKEKEFLMRFEREARAAALLRSPHVVRVFDVDVSSEGLSYMVMELLEGRDLADEVVNAPPSVPQLVDWVVQACSGLQEAHDNGIVHRDLKPPNIFLTKIESGERIAKVLDFGISKLEATSTFHLTNRVQGALGTPTYMAPEQIRNRPVDGRADLWALGVMLYRLLGARWPFSGKGDQGYMAAVLADLPTPFEVVRPDLPNELAGVIMKALEKDVAHRHQSATDFANALLPFGSGRAPLPSRASLPAAVMPASRSMAAITPSGSASGPPSVPPSVPRQYPIAIVMPAGTTPAQVSFSGHLDTIADGTRSNFGLGHGGTPPPHAVLSPRATPFVQPASPGSKTAVSMLVAAACVMIGLGFATYLLVTAPRKTTTTSTAAPPGQSSALPAEPLPPPALELPSPSADPLVEAHAAPTGVPASPSSAPPPSALHKRPPRAPAAPQTGITTSPPSPPGAAAQSPAATIPDHL